LEQILAGASHREGLIPDFERGIYASVVVDAKIVPGFMYQIVTDMKYGEV
jgi:hypothetical protein